MELFLILLLSAVGFFLLAKGGDIFVDSAIVIAKKLKMPTLLIGATIVSVGTTLPEILVSTIAAAQGDVSLALSNATGSMLCNLALVLGVSLACVQISANRRKYLDKFIFAFFNIILIIVFMIDGKFSLYENITLLILFAVFMAVNIREALPRTKKLQPVPILEEEEECKFSYLTVLLFLLGATCIALGAKFLVDNISILATDYMKIPTAIVGGTVVAFGTSLPEFITALNSIKKKNIDMSIGNVLGANIINGTFLVGLSGAMQGTAGIPVLSGGDLTVMLSIFGILAALLITVIPILIKNKTYRWQGITMLSLYALYVIYVVLSGLGVFA